jgi:hypothetical protein
LSAGLWPAHGVVFAAFTPDTLALAAGATILVGAE